MSEIKRINEINYLLDNNRVFLSSGNINIFPCSRRGQYADIDEPIFYDPEARLNTERTNRIGAASNGFTDSFIESYTRNKDAEGNELSTSTLVFMLAGYRVEIKNLSTSIIDDLGVASDKIYAHLSLHKGVSLNVESYFTEILYRQSTELDQKNYLDVSYTDNAVEDGTGKKSVTDYFFVGVSFTNTPVVDADTINKAILEPHNLPLFEKVNGDWQIVQTSLLPKIAHGETENSIKVAGNVEITDGNLIVKNGITTRIGNLNVSEGGINATKGKITALNSQITNNIDTSTLKATTNIVTPLLKTNEITSDNSEIVVSKVLKVDTISSDSTNGLTVKQAAKLDKTLTVEGAAVVNDTLTTEKLVATKIDASTGEDKGEIKTPKLRVNTITSDTSTVTVDDKAVILSRDLSVLMKKSASPKDSAAVATIDKAVIGDLTVQKDDTNLTKSTGKITAGNLTVGQYINVGSPAIPTTTAGDVVAKNSIYAENNIVAKNTLKAPAIYQSVNSSDKPVPYIDIVERPDGQWQLQISRASTIEKEN